MATYGKFSVLPVSGSAGTTEVSAKLDTANTGRSNYIKYIKHYMTNDLTKNAVMTLTAVGKAAFLTLGVNSKSVAWNIENTIFDITTNASKFRIIKVSGKDLTLIANSGYTVANEVGTFTSDPGLIAEFTSQVKVGISQNTTSNDVSAVYTIEFWDDSSWVSAGNITVNQSSADAGFSITSDPAFIAQFTKVAGYVDVVITANASYTINESPGDDVSWMSITNTSGVPVNSGVAGNQTIRINVLAQPVASPIRDAQINFKNPVSGSIIMTLNISQAAGDARAISLSLSSLSFAQGEVNVVKTFNVVANDIWYSEESLS